MAAHQYEKRKEPPHYQIYIATYSEQEPEEGEAREIIEIGLVAVAGKGFGNDLERIVRESGAPPVASRAKGLYDNYAKQSLDEYLTDTRGKVTVEVDNLPGDDHSQVLGMYDPNTDTVYVLRTLPPLIKQFVLEHEYIHRERHYKGGTQNETSVDQEATSRLGYNPLPQGSGAYLQAA